LVHKLELDERQATQVAKILEDLKIERAQAEVDDRRATASFADAVEGESFDAAAAEAAAKRRAETAERLGAGVQKALGQMHAVLSGEQRETLAFLIRGGALGL
jgi:Spy/CpxP family protein refolding chaperone